MKKIKFKTLKMPFKNMKMTVFSFTMFCLSFIIFFSYLCLVILKRGSDKYNVYIGNFLGSILLMPLIFVPQIVTKIIKFEIPSPIEVMYVSFLCAALMFGEIFNFYGMFDWWDNLLHLLSGFFIGMIAYYVANTFNHYGSHQSMSPLFLAIFAISLTLALGVIWEFVEYSVDAIFKTNMQGYRVDNSTLVQSEELVGHAALSDTMNDLLMALLGSGMLSLIATYQLKKNKTGFATSYFEKIGDRKA